MGQGDRPNRRTPNSNSDQFRTPDKPAPSSSSSRKLKRIPARLAFLVDTPGTAPGSAPSTASSTTKSLRKSSARIDQAQTTLTQIDFVEKSQNPKSNDDDDGFGYIESTGRNAAKNAQVIEIEDDEDGTSEDGRDPEYRSFTTSKSKRTPSIKSEKAPRQPKKPSNDKDGSSKKGRKKSGDKNEKDLQKKDNTLTQMNYVRRIVVEPDEDVKMEFAYIIPQKKDAERQTVQKREADDVRQDQSYNPEPLDQHKKRKLSPFSNSKGSDGKRNEGGLKASRTPATPRKTAKAEIPSSQSPESPGVAFITSSQFHHNTRSPQNRGFQALTQPDVKAESPELDELYETRRAPIYPVLSQFDPVSPSPSLALRRSTERTPPDVTHALHQTDTAKPEASIPSNRPSSTHRTVIYETDADTDYSEPEDDPLTVPSSPRHEPRNAHYHQAPSEDDLESPNIESQELPPPPLPEQEIDLGPLATDSTLLSDASILYQRIHAATQFPLDPIPTINTQKMAELFPDDSTGLQSLTAPSQSSTPMKPPSVPNQRERLMQDESQDQSESQEAGDMQTEVVPESSPIVQHESLTRFGPAAPGVVVQVESSQPGDRIQRRRTEGRDTARRGILSRSQILSSSVMESVPIPAFWMSSQDSVGEPYALPES
ncbi:hypothetical protein ASPCAL06572 [Aspergillus calidoustus]|uniref:Uncharacterized protein n=1 Tax=Aspergillus calidoustus TaxID=454130 RepID=A0A0U5G4H6_ASPCI|nr:hypothetical protein ASPCAL06572 [Aspergillus calidoustus]